MQKSLFLLALLPAGALGAGAGPYCYDEGTECGPENWANLDPEVVPNNECGGDSNSPIAVDNDGCTVFADYSLTVSSTIYSSCAQCQKKCLGVTMEA